MISKFFAASASHQIHIALMEQHCKKNLATRSNPIRSCFPTATVDGFDPSSTLNDQMILQPSKNGDHLRVPMSGSLVPMQAPFGIE